MSIKAINFSYLVCDACGTTYPTGGTSATVTRIAAAADGWKYAEWKPRQRGVVDRFDACPQCPLPADAGEATAIKNGDHP
jgi:hypothetical protein